MNNIILIIASSILLIDQISKILTTLYFQYNVSYSVINNLFYFTLNNNYGAAFGIFASNKILLIVIAISALIIIGNSIKDFKKNKHNNIAFSFLLGGIMGNLLDRIFFGYVRDFIDIRIFSYDFPIFNIADMALVIGTILIIISIFKGDDKYENNCSK